MSIVTAIVSPSARPSPRMTPPMMPERAYGSTASRIISHRVAPSASAASRCERGTASSTSRDDRRDVRQDHDREDHPAASMLLPYAGPEKSGVSPRSQRVAQERHDVLAKERQRGRRCPRARRRRWESRRAGRRGTTTGWRSQRGANSERKIATPSASGVAMISASDRADDRAEDRRRRAELPAHGVPVARR